MINFPEMMTDEEMVLRSKEWMLAGLRVFGADREYAPKPFEAEKLPSYASVRVRDPENPGMMIVDNVRVAADYTRSETRWVLDI